MHTVPTVTTYGKRVVVTREDGTFVDFITRTGAVADDVAKGLRGCLADAFHAGREAPSAQHVEPHELDDVEEEWPTLGTQTSCEHCDLDVEWHGDRWLDRGGNWTCPHTTGEREHEHEGRDNS